MAPARPVGPDRVALVVPCLFREGRARPAVEGRARFSGAFPLRVGRRAQVSEASLWDEG